VDIPREFSLVQLIIGVGIGQVRSDFDMPESGLRKIYKPESGLWPIIGRFSWPSLT